MEAVKRFFKNDKFAERANIELLSVSPGQASAKMTLHPHHLNGYGTVQGGSHLYAGRFRVCRRVEFARDRRRGINVSITFMKAGQTGTLWAEGKEVSRNFKLGSYTVQVKDDQGELVALFQGLAYRKAEKIQG